MIYIAHSENELRKTFELCDGKAEQLSFEPGTNFTFERHEIRSLDDVADLLRRLADDPHRAIVMGRPLQKRGERNGATFTDEDTDLWFIDLDGAPTDDDHRATIERCLPFLRGKRYVFAYSQSAGLKPGLRCRIVCRLPRAMSAAEREAHARRYNDHLAAFEGKAAKYIDSGIYAPARLLFTARPRLLGLGDPHAERVFIVEGEDVPVTLDQLPELVAVTVQNGRAKFDELPRLVGFGQEGKGHGRSGRALNAIGWLRAYMGEDDWADEQKRLALWHEMLSNAGATTYERNRYGDFAKVRAKDARPPAEQRTVLAVPNPDHSVPLDQAHARLGEIIERAVRSQEPRVFGVGVTMGVGKTHQMIQQIVQEYRRRTADNPFGAFNVDLYVPTMQMAEEAKATAERLGIEAFVEYGRGQEFEGEPVCIKADSAGKLQGIVENVAQSLCYDGERMCEHYAQCRWQWQRDQTHHIPLRIRANNYLSLMVRAEGHHAFRSIDLAVIDEASFVARLTHEQTIEIADLIAPRLTGEAYGWVLRFAAVLNESLTLDRLVAAGFTADVCRMLIKAEEELRPRVEITPDMDPKATGDALTDFDEAWHRYASVWRRLRDCLEKGSLNRLWVISEKGRPVRLSLAWKSPIKGIPWDNETGRPKIPVLLLSGTMRRPVIEQFLPVDEWHEIEAAPHPGTVIEQADLSGSKAECLYGSTLERQAPRDKGGMGEDDRDKIKAAQAVRSLVKAAVGDDVLITYKELEEQIGADAHFGAVEGINAFSGRDTVIYGRPLPRPRVMETQSRAIFCDDPEPIREIKSVWYPKRPVARRGQGYADAYYHPDPRVEDVRWMTCEGDIMQAVHRARLVRHPVKVRILNDTPLPLRIDRVTTRYRLHPQWTELESGKVLPLSQNEYLRLWPALFKDSRTGGRYANDNKERFHESRAAFLIEYRLVGSRGPMKRALVDGVESIRELGDVSEWRLADDARNDWALSLREMVDLLHREPLVDDRGELVAFDADAVLDLMDGSRFAVADWGSMMRGQRNLCTASTYMALCRDGA